MVEPFTKKIQAVMRADFFDLKLFQDQSK